MENNLNYIPMKLYGRTNRSRSLPFIRQATLNAALKSAQKKTETPTFKEGLQLLETSHNEIVYKAYMGCMIFHVRGHPIFLK